MPPGNPRLIARSAKIERAENKIASCLGISLAVERYATEGIDEEERDELLIILAAVARLKALAQKKRKEAWPYDD